MPTLDWLNRAEAFTTTARVPYRLLEQVSVHTSAASHDPASVRAEPLVAPTHDNLLIQGDNLEALKALLAFYRGRIKCIFIDPPYNTKSAFEHYDDNLEHAQWLSMMLPRFECVKALDREQAVKHWIRNLEQVPEFAFWLPTATDYFYPDFVAELDDGRLLVVEYKGDAYATNDDSREKRLVGERWAQTTGQRFEMVEKLLNGMDMASQIRAAIGA